MLIRCLSHRRARGLAILALPILAIVLGPTSERVKAQTTGTIYGTIVEAAGAAVAGASVTVQNLGTGMRRTHSTEANGSFNFPLLPVGRYSITVEASGFKTYREEVQLRVEDNLRIDLKLEIGEVTEEVFITTEAPQIDTKSSTLGKVVEQKRIVELPLNG